MSRSGAAAAAIALAAAGDVAEAAGRDDPVVFFTGASHGEGRLSEALKRDGGYRPTASGGQKKTAC